MLKTTHKICFLLGCCCLLSPMCIFSFSSDENQSTRDQMFAPKRTVNSNNKFSKTSKYFVRQIFEKYGHDGLITYEGFELLLISLGLDLSGHVKNDSSNRIFINHPDNNYNHHATSTSQENRTVGIHDSSKNARLHSRRPHEHSSESDNAKDQTTHPKSSILNLEDSVRTKNQNESTVVPHRHQYVDPRNKSLVITEPESCLSPSEILSTANINFSQNISETTFLLLCPVILYQLDRRDCRHNLPSAYHYHKPNVDGDDILKESITTKVESNHYAWFYSTMAVLVISVTGLFSVAVVPIIQKFCYKYLLQFLVALAVGSLTGDALLHLLPHAMKTVGSNAHKQSSSGQHDDHDHDHGHDEESSHTHSNAEIWLGLMALGGICLFFCAERFLNMIVQVCRKRSEAKTAANNIELNKVVGEKLSKHRYRDSYGYTYEGVSSEVLQRLNEESGDDKRLPSYKPGDNDVDHNVSSISEKKLLSSADLQESYIGAKQNGTKERKFSQESVDEQSKEKKESDFQDSSMMSVVVSDGKGLAHSHTHGHGHGHSHQHSHGGWQKVPQTALATAWMVIAGDGLHNFCDGMAIGAAFANSLTGGLSTAIAVFCHELPHELGDFALLLKAGMPTRQALLYNGLSSLLCLLGMLVGLGVGNVHSANAWVFAGAAGMFLYIALVDMLPELNSEAGDSELIKFGLQAFGISCGITIMCLIAIYEHDLQTLIED